jgi:hypothetical protein
MTFDYAQWNGGSDEWAVASNWANGVGGPRVPLASDDARFPNGPGNCILAGASHCRGIDFHSDGPPNWAATFTDYGNTLTTHGSAQPGVILRLSASATYVLTGSIVVTDDQDFEDDCDIHLNGKALNHLTFALSAAPGIGKNTAIRFVGAAVINGNLTISIATGARTLDFTTFGDGTLAVGNDLTIAAASALNQSLAGVAVTVGGDFLSGAAADALDLDTPGTFAVTGTAVAHSQIIRNCDFSGGTTLDATDACTDGGGNLNVDFGVITETGPASTIAIAITWGLRP